MYHFISYGSRTGNAILRVGRSFLNEHKFSIGLSETKLCICGTTENNDHFLLSCFLYTEERRLLFNTVEQILPTFKNMTKKKKIETLLYGINLNISETDCHPLPAPPIPIHPSFAACFSQIIYLVYSYIIFNF